MSDILERARQAIRRIMEQFDSLEVQVQRKGKDAYGQPTGAVQEIGKARIWMNSLSKPNGWKLREAGVSYDDANAQWACLLYDDAPPPAEHEDIVLMPDGTRWKIRNIFSDQVGIRLYWQLEVVT